MDWAASAWACAVLALAIIAWSAPRGAAARLRARRAERLRRRLEDALKHVLTWDQRGQNATPESLAGALGVSSKRVLELLTRLEQRGLIVSSSSGIRLTPAGERLGLHVMRAHRLWERYLADDAGVPMARLHQAAERAEHELTPETLDALEAHLGHPEHDPHGDPIPTAAGEVARLNAVALTDWSADEPALIVHVEDEPEVIFEQILAAGLRPGKTLRVLDRSPERIIVSDGENEQRLTPAAAANIQVAPDGRTDRRLVGAKRLAELRRDERATVVELDRQCRGFTRRRLMDLGLTPGTRVEVALENTFGDPRAFRVRGTTIALRRPQAEQVWVRLVEDREPSTEGARRPA